MSTIDSENISKPEAQPKVRRKAGKKAIKPQDNPDLVVAAFADVAAKPVEADQEIIPTAA